MTHIGFPFTIGDDGRTAGATADAHVRQLIELVLFTEAGERVHRPDFGGGLRQLVFAGNSPELATATEFLVQGALQRHLSDLVTVEAVEVTADEERLEVLVRFRSLASEERRQVTLTRSL